MNERIKELLKQSCGFEYDEDGHELTPILVGKDLAKFAELIVEATLTQVAERAYYTSDRDWSDELDRPWIQLEFGYGPLAEMKNEPTN